MFNIPCRHLLALCLIIFCINFSLLAQQTNAKRKNSNQSQVQAAKIPAKNESDTHLHLLKPHYDFDYGVPDTNTIKSQVSKIYNYLNNTSPTIVIDSRTNIEITDLTKIDRYSELKKGDFRITSYEWGVTYSGMLRMAEVTGDTIYSEYAKQRFRFLSEVVPYFKKALEDAGMIDNSITQVIKPKALDDAGAMCEAMIKASLSDKNLNTLRPLIDNYINYIMFREYRLADGTLARNRPQQNSVWLDDMYMGIPAIAYMGKLTGEVRYYNEAARQVIQFANRMFVADKNLFRHGWVEGMNEHPSFFWGRANGWALLTLCEVLDVLPENHPSRPQILDLLKSQIKGLASCQSGEGLWHQLLDRTDSYLETSASAIFVYGISHAINNGWIDGMVYGPAALLGWAAVAEKITESGQVEGTCVGTGMGFDPAYYYHRPVNTLAAHGYGTVLLAGAEVIALMKNSHPRLNDNAVQFYPEEQKINEPIFSVQDNTRPPAITAGSSRKGSNPVLLFIGDSTVKTGKGIGDNGQWGWGSFLGNYFDASQITVENHALGGRSSRTFITEGLWDNVFKGLKKGDYLMIQFGHNDGGPLNTGRARASLAGTGDESQTVIMERNGGPEEVFTFGHYLRIYVRQAKSRGAIPIILSPTPQNKWENNTIARYNNSYTAWAKEVAAAEGALFIDLNEISAQKCEQMGIDQAQSLIFKDSVHTSKEGALMNCQSILEALKKMNNCDLKKYILTK